MRRYDCAPVMLLEQKREMAKNGGPTWHYTVTPTGGEGSIKTPQSYVSLMFWPAGWTQPWGKPDQFEYHTLHEEIFFLSGTMNFGGYYSIKALGYCNHPPFWLHATNFYVEKNDGLLTMLYRGGQQPIVQLQNIPKDWDGRPYFAPATRSIGTRNLQLDDLAWASLKTRENVDTGLLYKRVAEDRDDGWTTWLMKAPPRWTAPKGVRQAPGGDEIYVIEGDLALKGGGLLRKSGYVCNTSEIIEGTMASVSGALFVRWTKGADALWNVAPQV